jgi:hypothetical protein
MTDAGRRTAAFVFGSLIVLMGAVSGATALWWAVESGDPMPVFLVGFSLLFVALGGSLIYAAVTDSETWVDDGLDRLDVGPDWGGEE